MRRVWLASVLGVILVALAPDGARADTVVLLNGDLLYGELQVTELPVVTSTGTVKVGRGDIVQVTVGTLSGDAFQLRNGRAVYGMIDLPSYSIRLRSGQTVVLARTQVGVLRFAGR